MFHSNRSITRRPASLHRRRSRLQPASRARGFGFPGFNGTIRALRLPVARAAALRCLRLAVPPVHARFAPVGVACNTDRPGGFAVRAGSPCRFNGWRPRGLPRSCRTPIAPLPCSSTPAGSWTSGRYDATTRPPLKPRRRLPRIPLSRLNHTASVRAVYASQCGLPRHHARLASGCRPALPGGRNGPQGSYGRFLICSSLHVILLPQTSWRKVRLVIK